MSTNVPNNQEDQEIDFLFQKSESFFQELITVILNVFGFL
jgi:hypothetical protein